MGGESDVGDGYEREPPVLGGAGRRPDRDRGCAITAREEASGTSVVDDEAVGRGPTTAPAPLRVPRAMGARCAPRERRVPVCVSRSGDVAPVTINGAHHRPPVRLRPRPGGIGRSRRGRPAGRGPALAPVRAARSGRRRRRTARHPVPPRFALPGRHGPGAEAGEAARSGPAAAPSPQSEPVRASRPDRESLRSPSPQPELQPLPGEPPGGSLTGTATTPRNAPGRLFGDGGGVESEIDPDAPLEPPGVLEDAGCGGIGGMVVRGGPARSGRQDPGAECPGRRRGGSKAPPLPVVLHGGTASRVS